MCEEALVVHRRPVEDFQSVVSWRGDSASFCYCDSGFFEDVDRFIKI